MIHVQNRKTIWHLGWKSLKASRTRNIIAILSIALTSLLFTALFTVCVSLKYSFEQETFRQVGGDFHGTFKNITKEQMQELISDPLVINAGGRLLLGMPQDPPFHKTHVEISYMDEVCAKGYFCEVTHGTAPAEGTMEIACDTRILELLGIEPQIGASIPFTYDIGAYSSNPVRITDTFILSGWWDYDPASNSSMAIVPLSYAENVLADYVPVNGDTTGTWDLNIYLKSAAHIGDDLNRILANHGYQSEDPSAENYINIGVNWAYLGSQLSSSSDFMTIAAIAALLLLIVFTGYLIIYNIFQISVSNDIRFYGILKTIGTTKRQLGRIIRMQAVLLSAVGIPIGLAAGYLCGRLLSPIILSSANTVTTAYVPANPWIFIGAALFSFMTVLISCFRPGRMAGKVSPIEAIRYTEGQLTRKKTKLRLSGTGKFPISRMAIANLGRNKTKTFLVVISLSLSVVLLQITSILANGFDMDKYLRSFVVSDFILGDANYFTSNFYDIYSLPESDIEAALAQGGITEGGRIYGMTPGFVYEHVTDEQYINHYCAWGNEKENVLSQIESAARSDDGRLLDSIQLYGMEAFPLDLLTVFEGSLDDLYDSDTNAIAAIYMTDDYENPDMESNWAHVGDEITLEYADELEDYDIRTGETIDDELLKDFPTEYMNIRPCVSHTVTYRVAACVTIRGSMSYRRYGDEAFILNSERFLQDSGTSSVMIYMFNTSENTAEAMETFLADYTEKINPDLDYESKATYSELFYGFRNMFILVGSLLSAVIGLVGILNFLNAVLTSIMTRRREFAMLQSIGMTGIQLKKMLILEGALYGIFAILLSLILSLLLNPLMKNLMNGLFWFITYRFNLYAVLITLPVFLLLGILLPLIAYHFSAKQSIVERLRELES